MRNNTNISERLRAVINYLGINKNLFARSLGYKRSQAVYDIINGKSKPSFDFFYRFMDSEYSDKISIDWLILGKGEMIKEQSLKQGGNNRDKADRGHLGENVVGESKVFYGTNDIDREILRLNNIIIEKESLLEAKDEIIKLKDEIIVLLRTCLKVYDTKY